MSVTPFAGANLPLRSDLLDAHEAAWRAIASPGTWLDAERRLAVVAEIRHARACALCARIKEALSPNAVAGAHETTSRVSAAEVELIHRVVNDPGRLSESWVQSVIAQGLTEGEYVEIASLIAMVMVLDTCTRALGLPDRSLPEPVAGEPTRYRPPGAKTRAAWLPITEPEDVVEADGPMYPNPRAGYIYRALSSVPQSMRDYWALVNTHYLPGAITYRFDQTIRAIARPQTELLASRVSALHQCLY